QSIELAWLALLGRMAVGKVVGVESARVSLGLVRTIGAAATRDGWTLKMLADSPVDVARARHDPPPKPAGRLWAIDPALAGRSVAERLAEGRHVLVDNDLQALVVSALDELAWIANLRGDQFAYQATFRGQGVVLKDALVLAADKAAFTGARAAEDAVRFVDDDGLAAAVTKGARVGVDPSTTPHAVAQQLIDAGAVLVEVPSPYALLRTKKTPAELAHMQHAFARADAVIDDVQKWLALQLKKNRPVTEYDVAQETERRFRESGAFGLSFKVISAVGVNGAVVHYSTPSKARIIKAGELFLLDTGAYYEGGYATDLTRTFLAGPSTTKATKEQMRLYTLVLKAAIAGMSARVPVGVTGEQLDAIVRDPLWRAGLDYGHGTGHGVGVNVHEAPPSVRIGSRITVEPGQVFSIEPGVYLNGWGGVRIENLCTVVEDTVEPPAGVPRRFLRVKPLTFSPLDNRLIDRKLLSDFEKRFLAWFKRGNRSLLPPTQ
ncbi:MAG TPA: M24 family metallopeptidase, partial [Myxococcota bacterium]